MAAAAAEAALQLKIIATSFSENLVASPQYPGIARQLKMKSCVTRVAAMTLYAIWESSP